MKTIVALYLIFATLLARAEIHEIRSMREAEPWIARAGVVVFDLDNTVLEARQMLGSDQFFTHLLRKAAERGLSGAAATDWALERNALVQPRGPVRAVEEETPALIDRLGRTGRSVFALTARPVAWEQGTLGQLRGLGVVFPDGVRFLPRGRTKGEELLAALRASGKGANGVVFIDDKLHHVESVERALTDAGYQVWSLRYGAADATVAAFDPAVADFEWDYFLRYDTFLSDAAARALLRRGRADVKEPSVLCFLSNPAECGYGRAHESGVHQGRDLGRTLSSRPPARGGLRGPLERGQVVLHQRPSQPIGIAGELHAR